MVPLQQALATSNFYGLIRHVKIQSWRIGAEPARDAESWQFSRNPYRCGQSKLNMNDWTGRIAGGAIYGFIIIRQVTKGECRAWIKLKM